MTVALWDVIKESKDGLAYINSEEQYALLEKIFSKLDKESIRVLHEEWSDVLQEMQGSEEYNRLHISRGGIIDGGDDCFYMDFGNWLVAQGEELYQTFKEKGHEAVLAYIEKHDIPESDYTFECMVYVFHDFLN